MIKEIIKDVEVLSQKSERFVLSGEDDYIVTDLIDTANAHKDVCAGLAAIQLGITKRVIVVRNGDKFIPYINPAIVGKSPQKYLAVEGCLSIEGEREVRRHRSIKVVFTDSKGKQRCQTFNGVIAQILQHEIDHCNGILI